MGFRVKNMVGFAIITRKTLFYKHTCSYCIKHYSKPSNLMSKIFQPINVIPKDAHVKQDEITSKSQKLMLDLGLIRQAAPGTFSLLPLAQRSLQKLVQIVDREMRAVGAQKILLPTLTSGELWKTTGRWKTAGPELFRLQDRHKQDLVLSPTHEEAVTDLMASLGVPSYRQLPLLLYQISAKFRDEAKPRSGLLRAREFLMKDLYTFDIGLEEAKVTYSMVRDAYHRLFSALRVKYVTVQGDAGSMGGSISEEFHLLAEVGEDQLLMCSECGHGSNCEVCGEVRKCGSCGSEGVNLARGIEVGHCFILGTRYSSPLKASFLSARGKPEPLHMGCHGLGLTRILAASAECLSTADQLRWPLPLAPFTVCIIPPKEGSKEIAATENALALYSVLNSCLPLQDDILLDDRTSMTIGRRLREASRTGYPYIVVAGKSAMGASPVFEVIESSSGDTSQLDLEGLMQYLTEKCSPLSVC